MASNSYSLETVQAAIANEGLSWKASENQLTSLSQDERRKYLGLILTDAEKAQLEAETALLAAQEAQVFASVGNPASHDWRNVSGQNYVTEVKNQGGCGSCVSFGTVAAMEAKARIQLNNPGYAIDLSEAFMQFCGGGSCNGWGLSSGLEFGKATGTVDEACMPYKPQNMNCTASRCSDWESRLNKITNFTAHATTASRKSAIVAKGPVVAGMAVFNDFYGYSGGVYRKTSGATLEGYHCVCVVGYSDTQKAWIVKNSWGPNWGMGGYVLIGYNQPDVLIDTSWPFYDIEAVSLAKTWKNNIAIVRVYATSHTKSAWVSLDGLGWRRIDPLTPEGVTAMHTLFLQAHAHGKKVNVLIDGNTVYNAYAR